MPRPAKTTFNTSGFTAKRPDFTGYSLLPTSPFRSDGEAWKTGAQNITPDPAEPTMGWVSSGKRRARIRIACEHWTTNKKATDCRFGCEAKAQVARFVP